MGIKDESLLDWDTSWAQVGTTIRERDVWLLTDYIKRDYLMQRLPEQARALEVGCGSAKLAALIGERGARVTGVDLSWNALQAAKRNLNALRVKGELGQADAFRLPFSEGAFDAVLSTGLLEHFRDPMPIVAEMARVLRPGGIFFSDIAPLKFSLLRMGLYLRGMARHVTDEYPYRGRDIAGWLEKANLRNIQVMASGVVPPLGLVRKFKSFREWSFRHQSLWTRWDGTPMAEQLGFFYLAWAIK